MATSSAARVVTPGNQLQDGSSVFFKRTADANWTELPMKFYRTANNNKYYSATIRADISSTFHVGDVVQYYLRITYDDHDTTFLRANGNTSTPTDNEAAARAAPFTFPVESRAVRGQWGPVLKFPNVAIHTHVLPNGRVLMWGQARPSDGHAGRARVHAFSLGSNGRSESNGPNDRENHQHTSANLGQSEHHG